MTPTPAPASTTYPTPEQLTALALVGRVVTDGAQVGILRMVDGPDWVVLAEIIDRAPWDTAPYPARLISAPPRILQGVYASVRWHGTDHLSMVPLGGIRRGVTLAKH